MTRWGNTKNLLKILCKGKKLDTSFSFVVKSIGETQGTCYEPSQCLSFINIFLSLMSKKVEDRKGNRKVM